MINFTSAKLLLMNCIKSFASHLLSYISYSFTTSINSLFLRKNKQYFANILVEYFW